MKELNGGATHLQNVKFTISYPSSPFYPAIPIAAQFSGVLTADGQIHVRLDSGTIPGNPNGIGIPISGSFSASPNQRPMSYSGVLNDGRIQGSVR